MSDPEPSALSILAQAFKSFDSLDKDEGLHLIKSFRKAISTLKKDEHREKLNEFSENSDGLLIKDKTHTEIQKISHYLWTTPGFLIKIGIKDWLKKLGNPDNGSPEPLDQALIEGLGDIQVEGPEFAKILSEYGLLYDSKIYDGNDKKYPQYIDEARAFAKEMGVDTPSDRLLKGLALIECEAQRQKSLVMGDVKAFALATSEIPKPGH